MRYLVIISALICALVASTSAAASTSRQSANMCTYRYHTVLIAFYGPRANYEACASLQEALGGNWRHVSNSTRANDPTCAWASPNYRNFIAVAGTSYSYLT